MPHSFLGKAQQHQQALCNEQVSAGDYVNSSSQIAAHQAAAIQMCSRNSVGSRAGLLLAEKVHKGEAPAHPVPMV